MDLFEIHLTGGYAITFLMMAFAGVGYTVGSLVDVIKHYLKK